MIYLLIGLSLLFVSIGFIVTENNAKYILSGYNTMSDEERENVDIKAYIPYFKKFHIFLGISMFVIGSLLTYLVSETAGGIFLIIYPFLAYIYLIWKSTKYTKGPNTKRNKIGIYILSGILILIIADLSYDLQDNTLVCSAEKIEFQGSYGEVVKQSDIKTIELVNQIPEITRKINGSSLGTITKGYFKTVDGERVKLILNSDKEPYILVTKKDGKKIYFSAKEESNTVIYNKIKKTLPNILYK